MRKNVLSATVATLVLFFGMGLNSQLVWGEKDHEKGYEKRHGSGHDKPSRHGMGYGMGGHHATTGHLIRGLLRGAKEMGLNEVQIKKLKDIQLNLDRTRIRAEAEIKIAEREAAALIEDDQADLSTIKAKFQESARKQVSLRVTAIKARRATMAVLTPEQSSRVKMFHEMMRKRMKEGNMGHGRMKRGGTHGDPQTES